MTVSDAVARKIKKLWVEHNFSINKLSIMSGKSHNPTVLTIARIYDNLNIELNEFFDDKTFKDLDIEL